MAHWSEKYVGRPYVPGAGDCAALFAEVSKTEFGKTIPDVVSVNRAGSNLGRAQQMADGIDAAGRKVTEPTDGDAVLMVSAGRPSHIGVFCVVNGEPYVLHAMKSAGMVVLNRLRDLHRINLSVEGFYAWK